ATKPSSTPFIRPGPRCRCVNAAPMSSGSCSSISESLRNTDRTDPLLQLMNKVQARVNERLQLCGPASSQVPLGGTRKQGRQLPEKCATCVAASLMKFLFKSRKLPKTQ